MTQRPDWTDGPTPGASHPTDKWDADVPATAATVDSCYFCLVPVKACGALCDRCAEYMAKHRARNRNRRGDYR